MSAAPDPGTAVPGLLSGEQCEVALALFNKGASPAQVCQQLAISIDALWNTLHRDLVFQAAVRQAIDTLSHNVVTALYKSAIEGSVSAQQFWLKQRPAALWLTPDKEMTTDDFAHFTDLEISERLAEASRDLAAATPLHGAEESLPPESDDVS